MKFISRISNQCRKAPSCLRQFTPTNYTSNYNFSSLDVISVYFPIFRKYFSTIHDDSSGNNYRNNKIQEQSDLPKIRLSKLIASHGQNIQMSRRSAESMIQNGQVTIAGNVVTEPSHKLTLLEAASGGGTIKISGQRLIFPAAAIQNVESSVSDAEKSNYNQNDRPSSTQQTITPYAQRTRIWLANKLPGELVADHDPKGRPSLLERLRRGGVGKLKQKNKNSSRVHLKSVGRLDMMTEGIVVITNDGKYARDMELPMNQFHRTYRARVHGRITAGKLKALRSGMDINGVRYKGMKVQLEMAGSGISRNKGGGTNSWLRITCVEGKNRQIRRMLDHVGREFPCFYLFPF